MSAALSARYQAVCPKCGAAAGKSCRTRGGRATWHQARIGAYIAAIGEAEFARRHQVVFWGTNAVERFRAMTDSSPKFRIEYEIPPLRAIYTITGAAPNETVARAGFERSTPGAHIRSIKLVPAQ